MRKLILVGFSLCLAMFSKGQTAADYIAMGKKAIERESFDSAIIYYSKAIKLEPRSHLAYIGRGEAYHEKRQYSLAVAEYTAAIRLAPDSKDAYRMRASSHKNIDLKIADLTTIIRLDPGNFRSYEDRAYTCMYYDRYDLAIKDYDTLIKLNPREAPYYYKALSQAYLGKGMFDMALENINKVIELEPSTITYHLRGVVYNYFGEYELAINDFKRSLDLQGNYFPSSIDIMEPLVRLKRFSEAGEYYKAIDVVNLSNYFADNKHLVFIKKYMEAIVNGINQNDHATALTSLQEAEKEFTYTKKGLSKTQQGGFAVVLSLRAYVLEQLNRFDDAKQTYEQSLVINPKQPNVIEALLELEKKVTVLIEKDKTSPVIELITPQPSRSFSIESDNGKTQLVGRAKDVSGIAAVTINNVLVDKIEEDGLFLSNLNLKPGPNTITITATDKQGNSASKSFTIDGEVVVKKKLTVPDIPVIGEGVPTYYAILIAEKDYEDKSIPDLQNPVRDARELNNILASHYNFSQSNIDTLFNRSREEIMQVIVQRCNTLTENDNLVIFYAGHGTAIKDKYGDVDGYWIPVSAKKGLVASYISAEDINKALKQSNAKHILLIADACFSGAFTRELPKDANKAIQKQYKVSSRKVMASGNLEPVPDNSKFLFYLKKSLTENKEKYVSAKDLFDSFYKAIINNSDNLPQYAAIKNVGDEGGEFVFIKK